MAAWTLRGHMLVRPGRQAAVRAHHVHLLGVFRPGTSLLTGRVASSSSLHACQDGGRCPPAVFNALCGLSLAHCAPHVPGAASATRKDVRRRRGELAHPSCRSPAAAEWALRARALSRMGASFVCSAVPTPHPPSWAGGGLRPGLAGKVPEAQSALRHQLVEAQSWLRSLQLVAISPPATGASPSHRDARKL